MNAERLTTCLRQLGIEVAPAIHQFGRDNHPYQGVTDCLVLQKNGILFHDGGACRGKTAAAVIRDILTCFGVTVDLVPQFQVRQFKKLDKDGGVFTTRFAAMAYRDSRCESHLEYADWDIVESWVLPAGWKQLYHATSMPLDEYRIRYWLVTRVGVPVRVFSDETLARMSLKRDEEIREVDTVPAGMAISD